MAKARVQSESRNELVYVIAGKDPSLVNSECARLLDSLLEPSQRVMGLLNIDAKTAEIPDVLDELRTLPFLTDKRVVVIKDAEAFLARDNNRERLEEYFDSPCRTGLLVMTVSSWRGNTRLAKKLPGIGRLISVEAPKRWELPDRLVRYASEAYEKKFSKAAAEMLVELAGDDLPRLYAEVDKLALYAAGENSITAGHVESLIGHNRMFGAFEVIDSVMGGEVGVAVDRLRRMFAEDRSTEFTVVGAFAFHVRRMFEARRLLDGGNSRQDVVRQLRIWSNKDRFFAHLGRMSLRQIGGCLQQLAETDFAIKRGHATAQVAMEQFVLRLTQQASRAPGA